MDIVYIILWALLALYCYFMAHRISPILYLAGVFFTFMFGWYLTDYILPLDLMAGHFGIIFKVVAILFLVPIVILFYKEKKNSSK